MSDAHVTSLYSVEGSSVCGRRWQGYDAVEADGDVHDDLVKS
jgi:hypothetical protein